MVMVKGQSPRSSENQVYIFGHLHGSRRDAIVSLLHLIGLVMALNLLKPGQLPITLWLLYPSGAS